MPNASHIAFTGTPITFADRNTFELFGNVIHIYDMQQATLDVAGLIRKVVAAMKKEFQIGWTNHHRQDVLAKVTLAVKMVLMRENIKGEQLRFLTNAIVEKAKDKYKDWPLEA